MNDKKSAKIKIWVYAVVLFTSAFVVLLITAYSQIKFNKNIDDYRKQIFSNENEKNKFKLNLNSALEENIKLVEDLKSLRDDLSSTRNKVEEYEKEIEALKENQEYINRAYEGLALAANEFNKGNIVNCAEQLSGNVDPKYLNAQALQQYNYLVEKTYKEAAHELYIEGYKYFKKKIYSAAVKRFWKSLNLADGEYFSDDCYYLLAFCAYKEGDKETAKSYIATLKEKYPKSNYIKDADGLLKQLD